MPRTAVGLQTLANYGEGIEDVNISTATFDAVNGMALTNDGNTILQVNNQGTAKTVTVTTNASPGNYGQAGTFSFTFTASVVRQYFLGPFPQSIFNQSDGTVSIDADDNTDTNLKIVGLVLPNTHGINDG